MQRIFNLFKWFGRLLLAGVIILMITFVIFLNKPSLFIDDIEEITSVIINQNLNSDLNINIDTIDGDFVSGFYAKNTSIYINNEVIASLDSIYVNPNVSDLLFLKISFSNISLINPVIYHNNSSHLNFDNYTNKNPSLDLTSKIPLSVGIDDFYIDNGNYLINDTIIQFNGNFNFSYNENLNINIKSLDIHSGINRIFKINDGIVVLNDHKVEFDIPNYEVLGNIGQLNSIYDIGNKKLSKFDFFIKDLKIPGHKIISDLSVDLLATNSSVIKLNNSFLIDENNFKSTVNIDLNKIKKRITAQIDSRPLSDAYYDIDFIFTYNDIFGFDLKISQFNYNSLHVDDFKMKCKSKDYYGGFCEIESLGSIKSSDINLNDLSGFLKYDDENYFLDRVFFESNIVNGEITSAQYSGDIQSLSCDFTIIDVVKLSRLLNADYKVDGADIYGNITYHSNIDTTLARFNINSSYLTLNDFSLSTSNINYIEKNDQIEYQINIYDPKFLDIHLDSLSLNGSGKMGNYSNNLNGYNSMTGENIESNFSFTNDSTMSIEFIKGKLKDVPFYSDNISFNKQKNLISSSPISINFGLGEIYSQIKFLDSGNYLLNLRASQIDLIELKKIFQFQDRINGVMNGEIYLSYEKSQPTILTNLNFRNGNFDDILFKSLDIQASFRNNRLTFSEVDIDTDIGLLKFSGWLTNLSNNFSFRDEDRLSIEGEFDQFEISYLMRYFPWEEKTSGLLSGKISISGEASSPRIELQSRIKNPSFDRIIGESISGDLIYKNKRLYLKGMNLKTSSGQYTGTGSIPADLSIVKIVDMNILEQPLDFIITGKSNSFEFLTPYIDEIESINGEFTMQLGLSGTLQNPIRGGQLSIQNTKLELLQLDNSIESLSGIATIANNKLIIKKLSGQLVKSDSNNDMVSNMINVAKNLFTTTVSNKEHDNIAVNGTMDLTEFFKPNYTISIDADDAYLNSTYGQFEGEGDAEILITGKDTLLVSGEFRPSPHNFKLFNLGDDYNIDMVNITNDRLVKYDIHVPFQDGIIIDMDEVNMIVDGDMNIITANNDDIAYSGKINIIDGTFNYNNNEFSQATGKLILDPSKQSPYAEINARTQLLDESIDVTFIGFLDNPNLILESSSEQYSQSDILRLLTFKESNVIDDPSATGQIGELLANYMEKELEKNVSLYTELDEFKVNRSGSVITGLDDSNINVFLGKRISSNLYLNTKINLNQSDKMNEYEISYRLNRNMSIVAKVDEYQHWHINYRYKYKY